MRSRAETIGGLGFRRTIVQSRRFRKPASDSEGRPRSLSACPWESYATGQTPTRLTQGRGRQATWRWPPAPERQHRSGGRVATAREPAIYGSAGTHMGMAFRCTCTPMSDVHSPSSTDPRRSAFKSCLQGAVSRRAAGFRRGGEAGCDEHSGSMGRPALRVSTLSGHVGRPVVHQPTPALEQVRAPIRRLVPVLDPTSSPIYCPEKSGTVNTESSRPIRVHRRCGPFDPPHTGSR